MVLTAPQANSFEQLSPIFHPARDRLDECGGEFR